MIDEVKNSHSGDHGQSFPVKDRLFTETNLVCATNTVTLILQNVTSPHFHSRDFLLIPGRRVSVDHFLNRLPKVAVKAGRVIHIRDSVRDTLQVGNCCSTTPSLFGLELNGHIF